MATIFFYGLFMDLSALKDQGLQPEPLGAAKLCGYKLVIASRASLVPAPGRQAFGVLARLPQAAVDELYAAPSVRAYCAESVTAIRLADDQQIAAVCYNLPPDELRSPANTAYARQLAELVREHGFPASYQQDILAQAGG